MAALEAQSKGLTPPQEPDHCRDNSSQREEVQETVHAVSEPSLDDLDPVEEIIRDMGCDGFPMMDVNHDPFDMSLFEDFSSKPPLPQTHAQKAHSFTCAR